MIKIVYLIFLFLFTSLFTGCHDSSIKTHYSETEQAPGITEQPAVSETQVSVVGRNPNSIYLSTHKSGKTEHGYYHALRWMNEMYEGESESIYMHNSNITYIDYASGVLTYLCSVPGCLHNNESCTSFIRYPRGIEIFPNHSETYLFVLALGAMDGEALGDEDLARIYRMDMDGSNRKEIYKLPANESFNTFTPDSIIADEQHLYITVHITKSSNETIKELRKINIETGEAETLLEMPIQEMIYSAFDDTIIITDISKMNDLSRAYDYHQGSTHNPLPEGVVGYTTYAYSLTDNTKTKIFDWPVRLGMIDDNYFFAIVRTSDEFGNLIVHDLRTGEQKVIENVPANTEAAIFLSDYYDENVILSYTAIDQEYAENNEPVFNDIGDEIVKHKLLMYAINIKTGQVKELTLRYNEGTFNDGNVGILSETENGFLVISNVLFNSTKTIYDRAGVAHTYPYSRPVYALIDKDDYYNSIPNYRIIEDLI